MPAASQDGQCYIAAISMKSVVCVACMQGSAEVIVHCYNLEFKPLPSVSNAHGTVSGATVRIPLHMFQGKEVLVQVLVHIQADASVTDSYPISHPPYA